MDPHLLCHHLHASESSRVCVCLCASPFTYGDHIVFGCMQIGIGLVKRGHFPGGSDGKESAYYAGDLGSIPGLGRSLGEGKKNSLQDSCLRIPWTEEPGGLQSIGSQRVEHNWAINIFIFTFTGSKGRTSLKLSDLLFLWHFQMLKVDSLTWGANCDLFYGAALLHTLWYGKLCFSNFLLLFLPLVVSFWGLFWSYASKKVWGQRTLKIATDLLFPS